MTLAERLKALVELVPELSLRELAEITHLSPGYPSLIASGERKKIGADVAAKLASALGTTVEYLVAGVGQAPSRDEIVAAVVAARAAKADASTPTPEGQEKPTGKDAAE